MHKTTAPFGIPLDYLRPTSIYVLQNAVGKMRSLTLVLTSFNLLQVVVRCQELSVIRHSDGDIFTIEGKYTCFVIGVAALHFFCCIKYMKKAIRDDGRKYRVENAVIQTFAANSIFTRASCFSLETLISICDFSQLW